ncbi:MAG: SPFH/Band 7/PHB domain protein [Calditrichaeota bacterium]|nr:SPFH/Band 7/PHB domain protein [Calditrichota bacterium]
MTEVTGIMIAIALFVIVFAVKGLVIIQQAQVMVIERLGKFHRILGSGIHIIWPILETPRRIEWKYVKVTTSGDQIIVHKSINRIDLRETVYDFPRQHVITKDNVVIEINALLYFQITDPRKAVYEIVNLPDAIEKLTQTTLRNVIGELDLDETLASRDTINQKLRAILDEATDKWGVKVNRVELQDITPPKDIKEAMEKQMRAERDRRAIILQAEGEKRSRILEAEGVRESQIQRANGEKQAKILRAQGEAEAKIQIAQAEAKAIELITKSIKESQGNPTQYLVAIKYIETLKEMVSGKENKVVYLPIEATGVLSSLGGIKELLSDHSPK